LQICSQEDDSPKCYHPLLLLTTEYPATPQKAKRSFRAAGKSCFCNDEIFFGGDGYYIFAKRADYIYKELLFGGVLMTITGMTRFVQQNYKVQNSHLTHKLPNGSLPPKEHVNPYCPEGMDITGRTDFRRIVPVDEGVANKIKSLVFESMEKNCGMSDGEIESEIIRNYVMSLPPEERAAAGWTLNQISLQEADRLGEYVHQRDPSWNWGKPVKPGILDDYKSGMNILI
jgi:hypothetical protein